MADVPPSPDPNADTGDEGTPRWVLVLGIIAIVMVLLFVIMHFVFGGFGGHGVRRP